MTQVLSKNIFDLLEDSDSPSVPAAESKTLQKTTAAANKPSTAASVSSEKKPQQAASRTTDYPRRGGFAGGKVIRPEDLVADAKDRRPAKSGHHHKGGKHGRGREFDRKSGTGRVDGEKKDVAGKGAWGNPLDAENVDANGVPVALDADGNPVAAVTNENGQVDAEAAAQEEENAKLMTLEQYLANKKPVGLPTSSNAAPRKANDGADNAQWKNTVVLKKDEEDYLTLNGKDEAKKDKNGNKQIKEKQFLAIEQRFADQERPQRSGFDGQRGARKGSRGGRGGNNGGRASGNYDHDFPALKA